MTRPFNPTALWLGTHLRLIYLFLYLPIAVLMVLSFNRAGLRLPFDIGKLDDLESGEIQYRFNPLNYSRFGDSDITD